MMRFTVLILPSACSMAGNRLSIIGFCLSSSYPKFLASFFMERRLLMIRSISSSYSDPALKSAFTLFPAFTAYTLCSWLAAGLSSSLVSPRFQPKVLLILAFIEYQKESISLAWCSAVTRVPLMELTLFVMRWRVSPLRCSSSLVALPTLTPSYVILSTSLRLY